MFRASTRWTFVCVLLGNIGAATPLSAEEVLVLSDSAEIKSGMKVLATPDFGARFEHVQVKPPWRQVEFSADGRTLRGWIHEAHLLPRGLVDDQLIALQRALDQWREGNEPAGRGDHRAALVPRLAAFGALEKLLGPNHVYVAERANVLAVSYFLLGDLTLAEPLYLKALAIKKAVFGTQHAEYALGLGNLAALYATAEDYGKAEPLFREALAVRKAVLGEQHPEYARNLNNLGLFYKSIGDGARAAPLYRQALEIYRASLGDKHPDYALTLANLAIVHQDAGEHAQAVSLLQEALTIQEAALGADHPATADTRGSLAVTYYLMRDFAQAEPLYRRAVESLRNAVGEEHLDYTFAANDLAALYDDMAEADQAEPLFRQALEVRRVLLGEGHSLYAASLNNLGVHLARRGRWQDAADQFHLARKAIRQHVLRVLPALSEKEQLTFLRVEYTDLLGKALSVSLGVPDDEGLTALGAEWAVNGKAVAHEVLAARTLLARERSDPKMAPLVDELAEVRQRLASIALATPSKEDAAGLRAQWEDLVQQEEDLSRRLGQATGTSQRGAAWTDLADVRQALPPDTVLVEIVRMPVIQFAEATVRGPRYVAWLVPSSATDAAPRTIDLGDAAAIDRAVTAARKAIAEGPTALAELGEPEAAESANRPLADLAGMVFEPLVPHLGEATQVVLCPDADLWLVPWCALTLGDGRYVAEQYTVRYAPSGRSLVGTDGPEPQEAALVVANPHFGLPPADVARRTAELNASIAQRGAERAPGQQIPLDWQDLPATEAEARALVPQVHQLCGAEPRLCLGEDALEAVVKSARRLRIVVLSTHGYFLPDAPAAAAGPSPSTGSGQADNPLLRCGLVFSGANKRNERPDETTDDGLLTGLEIVGIDLRGTELVVLSACDTGLGQVRNGEGVAGLRQAFQLAGAQAVVATLWQVPDEDTAQIVSDFFANLAAGQTKATALRNAQLARMAHRREQYGAAHPLFWAAFTITSGEE
jgi:CHAT domain-containing protein/tetratricopeptide (TPR) repeat protein